MNLNLSNDTAVITGGASGIGKSIAELFAANGSSVVLVDRDPKVEDTAAEIRSKYDCQIAPMTTDVTDFSAMQTVAEFTNQTFARCDHLICAAGAGSGKYGFPFWNLEPADWENVLQVNLMGTVNAVQAMVPTMIAAKRGTILILSSVAGQIGSQTDPPYSAAKAAVINFAQCAAKDLAPYDVRVNTICPGMVKTPLNRSVWATWNASQPDSAKKSYDDWAAEKIRNIAPLNRWQDPEDVAAMAVFLASPLAKNITGQTINVDGGQVMHS
ncbi:SDR family NAD(P)-dependent oxidoreductase [Thalassoroseus pseudoceratinae]|uniref:SDR family NAD(P)-dependent oxidoreductase n=1 Tax=Thalassoroseus pseudoceratinae TaxID=2713176 RepID=UPI001421E619|nr:SDR family oxidoreductase [Thalassoroseus pseudoceratinae]